MMQIRLMQIAESMKPGEAFRISREIIVKAAEENLDSLLFDSVRESDIRDFAKQAELSWNVKMAEDLSTGDWTMRKLFDAVCPDCHKRLQLMGGAPSGYYTAHLCTGASIKDIKHEGIAKRVLHEL